MNHVRLYVWVGLTRYDIVTKYAPWALKAMTSEANCEAIGCKLTRNEFTNKARLQVAHSRVHINHWVVCIPSTASRGDGADSNLHISDSDANGTLTEAFLSVKRHVISTIADGNCGLDAMCIMLGLQRTAMACEALRLDIALFVLKHNANRALISALYHLQEVSRHMGHFELEHAAIPLFPDETIRGDGDDDSSIGAQNDAIAVPAREYTQEEVEAIIWKCNLQKNPTQRPWIC